MDEDKMKLESDMEVINKARTEISSQGLVNNNIRKPLEWYMTS